MGPERFDLDDLAAIADGVAAAWLAGADRDWSVPAGTLEWSCTRTADHAVDCVLAPAFFLASRSTTGYPPFEPVTMGAAPTAAELVEGLRTALRMLAGVVRAAEAEPGAAAVLWRRPAPEVRPPADFPPRAGLELALHGHDVCAGLGVELAPPPDACRRLRDHTASWPMWTLAWGAPPPRTDDPWADLLAASGRGRLSG